MALATREKQLNEVNPKFDKKTFLYHYTNRQYQQEYGDDFYKPGPFARILAWVLRVVPKVGPFKALAFRPPTPEVDKLFLQSFQVTLRRYQEYVSDVGANRLQLENANLDTGKPWRPAEYELADKAYAKLQEKLTEKRADQVQAAAH